MSTKVYLVEATKEISKAIGWLFIDRIASIAYAFKVIYRSYRHSIKIREIEDRNYLRAEVKCELMDNLNGLFNEIVEEGVAAYHRNIKQNFHTQQAQHDIRKEIGKVINKYVK